MDGVEASWEVSGRNEALEATELTVEIPGKAFWLM